MTVAKFTIWTDGLSRAALGSETSRSRGAEEAPQIRHDDFVTNPGRERQRRRIVLALQEGASVLSVDGEITKIAHVPHGEGSDREIIDVDTARRLILGYGCEDSDSIGRLQV